MFFLACVGFSAVEALGSNKYATNRIHAHTTEKPNKRESERLYLTRSEIAGSQVHTIVQRLDAIADDAIRTNSNDAAAASDCGSRRILWSTVPKEKRINMNDVAVTRFIAPGRGVPL